MDTQEMSVWDKASLISDSYDIPEFAALVVHMQSVIQKQQAEIDSLEKSAERFANRTKSLDIMRGIALDLVRDLARCGGYDHKGKNEAILAVISRLMAIHSNYAPRGTMPDNDDVPW